MERVGLYPGTFDPIHNGHIDIIERAVGLVDRLIIAVAINEEKKPLFPLEDRIQMVEAETAAFDGSNGQGRVEIRPFSNLVTEFADEAGAHVIVRGLRAVTDFDYEFQMAGMNSKLNPNVETLFLMADASHQAIASRLIREIAKMGGDVRQFVPDAVARRLGARYSELGVKSARAAR